MTDKHQRTTATAPFPRGALALGGALAALLLSLTAAGADTMAGGATTPRLDVAGLKESVHGRLNCVDCHRELAGQDPASGQVLQPRTAAGSAERSLKAREICGRCHAGHEVEVGFGRRTPSAPAYRAGVHGPGTVNGRLVLGDCTSCHEPHGILKATDPRNPVGAAKLATTCGQAGCHAGTTASLERGEVHGGLTPGRFEFLSVVRGTYVLTILATAVAMILHNVLHFLGRRRARRTVHG